MAMFENGAFERQYASQPLTLKEVENSVRRFNLRCKDTKESLYQIVTNGVLPRGHPS